MKFVLDSNILFSALIRESTTRAIILGDVLDLYAPEYIFSEIVKHKELILKKSRMSEADFSALIILLQRHIKFVSKKEYVSKMTLAEEALKDIDITDSPFLALAMVLNCSIWSNDGHFKKQDEVKVYTTDELIKTIIENQ